MFEPVLRLLSRQVSAPMSATQRECSTPAMESPAQPADDNEQNPPRSQPSWYPARLALNKQLWGPGYILPGGEAETLHLARPLGLSDAVSLLVVGTGAGGPACAVARNLGAWVTGVEADAALIAAARALMERQQLGKKVTLKSWDPLTPAFEGRTYHRCLALDPLQQGRLEPVLQAIVQALKPGGQLVMTALVADTRLALEDPSVRRWAQLEQRDAVTLPSSLDVAVCMERAGLDVRIVEDISTRHMEHVMAGWRPLLGHLRQNRPDPLTAAVVVNEAERCLLRGRLIRDGRVRLLRWYAMCR